MESVCSCYFTENRIFKSTTKKCNPTFVIALKTLKQQKHMLSAATFWLTFPNYFFSLQVLDGLTRIQAEVSHPFAEEKNKIMVGRMSFWMDGYLLQASSISNLSSSAENQQRVNTACLFDDKISKLFNYQRLNTVTSLSSVLCRYRLDNKVEQNVHSDWMCKISVKRSWNSAPSKFALNSSGTFFL